MANAWQTPVISCVSTPILPLVAYENTLKLVEFRCIFIYFRPRARKLWWVPLPGWIQTQKTPEMNELETDKKSLEI